MISQGAGARHASLTIMQVPSISFRDMEATPALTACVERWAAKLDRVYPRIDHCQVVIDRPHRHHHRGQHVRVRVVIAVPRGDIVARDGEHENAYAAIRDAFLAARRQLVHRFA